MELEATVLERLNALWVLHKSSWRRLFSRRAIQEAMLRASFDLDLLAPEQIANLIPKGAVPDCENCRDICCAGLENVVSLRLRDIAVLIDLGRTDLISLKKPRFPPSLVRERPGLEELMHSELWRALPVLKQVGELKVCAALDDNLRCTLYPHWPLSCERFPYSLSAVRKQIVWGKRCQSQKKGPEFDARSDQLSRAAVDTFNERVRDAVLLAHARPELNDLGIGAFLTSPGEDPFEAPQRLPII